VACRFGYRFWVLEAAAGKPGAAFLFLNVTLTGHGLQLNFSYFKAVPD
jgi:hypothetical protein